MCLLWEFLYRRHKRNALPRCLYHQIYRNSSIEKKHLNNIGAKKNIFKQYWLLNCLCRIMTAQWNLSDLISLLGKGFVSTDKETPIQLYLLTALTRQLLVGREQIFLCLIQGIGGPMGRRLGGTWNSTSSPNRYVMLLIMFVFVCITPNALSIWLHGLACKTNVKCSCSKNYYKEGDYVYPRFDAVEAYRRAITTWATWIKKHIKREKLVFYRGYSSAHFRYHFSYSALLTHYFDF